MPKTSKTAKSGKSKPKATKRAASKATADLPRGWGEFLGVALLAIGALMFGGLFSYQFGSGTFMGPVGQIVASALYAGFGMAGYIIALGVVGVGLKALTGTRMEIRLGEGVGFSFATIAGCVLLHVTFSDYRVHGYTAGGLSGELLGEVSLGMLDVAGTYLVGLTVLAVGLIASTPLRADHLTALGRRAIDGARGVGSYLWSGTTALIDAQREAYAEAVDEGDWDEEWEDELDEGEEEEEYEEDEPEATAARKKASGKKTPSKKKTAKAKAKPKRGSSTKNVKRTRADEDDAPETEPESPLDGELPGGIEVPDSAPKAKKSSKKSAKKRAKAASDSEAEAEAAEPEAELPEICTAEEGEASTQDAAAGAVPAEPTPKDDPNRKKAPPRAAQLGARKAVAAAKPAPKKEEKRGVQYLTAEYTLPHLELFAAVEKQAAVVDKQFVYEQAERIVETLAQFRVKGKVTKVHPGPVITRYEFKPEAGVKVSKIQNLENDLAMALEAIRIRILAPIPGKSTVGLEVPNKTRETVYVQENLADPEFGGGGRHALPLVLGKDIVGRPIGIDLAKAPHLLVAGATGSGKSVGVNSMICSLLYSRTPEELRMILIDPKMLEFSVYADIPHLMLPVITDAEKANLALRWTVNEMERRYALLSQAKVRDLSTYNKKVPRLQREWEAEKKMAEAEAAVAAAAVREDGDEDAVGGTALGGVEVRPDGQQVLAFGGVELPERPDKMPYIVVIIDEFADLMMVASKEVEANVARIAAKARAAGIHLIVATQRPSVDVITGTIKNNFPSRIAFQVTSDMDSRTILDQKGAKQLLGMGDMLYMDRGKEPARVHGCFVSEQEIERVVEFVKKQAKPAYDLSITRAPDADTDDEDERPVDPLYDKGVRIVAEAQKVSTSMLQRRLGIGYNRAAKIVDMMESQGVIGPPNGSKPREVYIAAA